MNGLREEIKERETLHAPLLAVLGKKKAPKILRPRVWITSDGNPLTELELLYELGDTRKSFAHTFTRRIQDHRSLTEALGSGFEFLLNPSANITRVEFKMRSHFQIARLAGPRVHALDFGKLRSKPQRQIA